MSEDNQEIIDNAHKAYLAGEITKEQENDAILLACTNEAELELTPPSRAEG